MALVPNFPRPAVIYPIVVSSDFLDRYPEQGDPTMTNEIVALITEPVALYHGDLVEIIDDRPYRHQPEAYTLPRVMILVIDRFLPINLGHGLEIPNLIEVTVPDRFLPTHWNSVAQTLLHQEPIKRQRALFPLSPWLTQKQWTLDHLYVATNQRSQRYLIIPWTMQGHRFAFIDLVPYQGNSQQAADFLAHVNRVEVGMGLVFSEDPRIPGFPYDRLIDPFIETGPLALDREEILTLTSRMFDNDLEQVADQLILEGSSPVTRSLDYNTNLIEEDEFTITRPGILRNEA